MIRIIVGSLNAYSHSYHKAPTFKYNYYNSCNDKCLPCPKYDRNKFLRRFSNARTDRLADSTSADDDDNVEFD